MIHALDLKLRLLSQGIDANSPAVRAIIDHGGHISIAEMAANGLDLYLQDQVLCNGPLRPGGLRLEPTSCGVAVFDGDVDLGEAVVVPRPGYAMDRDVLRDIEPHACLTVDRISSWLISGCRFGHPKDACRFCELPIRNRYGIGNVDRMVAAVDDILSLEKTLRVHHLQVTGGTPRPEDEVLVVDAIAHLAPSGLPVQWMTAPPSSLDLIARAKEAGAAEVAISLELFNEDARARYMPGKGRIVKETYRRALEEAVRVFGYGRVRSLLLVGIEPLDETVAAVAWLTSLGVIPVLSPFRPLAGTPLAQHPYPSYETLRRVLEESELVARNGGGHLGTRCIRCQYDVLAPTVDMDSDWYEHPITEPEVAAWRAAWIMTVAPEVC